ncbi:MAG: DUF3105 domain-containing protein [Anaerolinea sp.]|jgi:hypothetical protein|nr:DUF3105 domain-containing protein [Anaerolinea sp.]
MRKKAAPTKRTTKVQQGLLTRYNHLLTVERSIIGATILFILGIIAVVAFNAWQNRILSIDGIERVFGLPRGHEEFTTYPNDELPPMGGLHNPTWQNCGVYDTPIQNDLAVHSLEHGAVWITYRPELPTEQIERLRDITRGGSHRLLSPYLGLASPIVVTAWGYQLQIEDAYDSRLIDFISNYEQGPQSPEPGASCSGGIGEPIR